MTKHSVCANISAVKLIHKHMSLLNYLQFQPIDPSSDNDEIPVEHQQRRDIDLDEQLDEESLETFWSNVVDDIHDDPEWFTFSDE